MPSVYLAGSDPILPPHTRHTTSRGLHKRYELGYDRGTREQSYGDLPVTMTRPLAVWLIGVGFGNILSDKQLLWRATVPRQCQ